MRFGKLSSQELQKAILDKLKKTRKEVVLSAALGEDCAALKVDESFVLISTDPITAQMPPKTLGALAVDVACNDITANGGEAIALMITLIMPRTSSLSEIDTIMEAVAYRANEINVEIAGGHTEFSDCVTRPLISATAIGCAKRLISKSQIQADDDIYITKEPGIEGTVILFQNSKAEFSEEEILTLNDFKASLSVLKEGKILSKYENVSSLHDVTEGGILGAVAEICLNAKLGAHIYENSIEVNPLTKKICAEFNADVLRLISSGSLLFTGKNLDAAVKELHESGIKAVKIGEITNGKEVRLIRKNGESEAVEVTPDELFRVL